MRNEKNLRAGLPLQEKLPFVKKEMNLVHHSRHRFECLQNRNESIQMLVTTIEFAKENELFA